MAVAGDPHSLRKRTAFTQRRCCVALQRPCVGLSCAIPCSNTSSPECAWDEGGSIAGAVLVCTPCMPKPQCIGAVGIYSTSMRCPRDTEGSPWQAGHCSTPMLLLEDMLHHLLDTNRPKAADPESTIYNCPPAATGNTGNTTAAEDQSAGPKQQCPTMWMR